MNGKQCKACNFNMLDPSFSCPNCGADDIVPITLSGKGTIYTFTVVNVGFGHLATKTPYILAIVDLEEGLKVLTIIEDGNKDTVTIGDPVKFLKWDEREEPIFTVI